MLKRRPLREPESVATLALRVGDVAATVVAGWVTFWLYLGDKPVPAELYPYPVSVVILLIVTVFPLFGLYRTLRGVAFFDEVRILTAAWALIFGIMAVIALITKAGPIYSRAWLVSWFLSAWFATTAFRYALRRVLRWMRERGYSSQNVIIVGGGDLAREIIRRLQAAPWTGLRVQGVFCVRPQLPTREAVGVPVLGTLDDLPGYEAAHEVAQIWIALPLSEGKHLQRVLHDLRHSTADIRYVPDLFGVRLINHSVSDVAGIAVMNVSVTPLRGVNRLVKALEDRLLAALMLLIASPLILLIAVGVRLSSPGPVLYRQERVGWNGETFVMLKFRSMPVDVEQKGTVWGNADRKPTTRFGALLRHTGLDELPQFWNVLRGDMSIVGPRPERPLFVAQFKDEIPDYMKKHIVKAGITGWAQINKLRGDTDLAKRIEYDLYYIENWSLWFDLKIMFRTVLMGLTSGAVR